jgi:hypothetical protein
MSFLAARAYLMLLYFDLFLARNDFGALYNRVRLCPIASHQARGPLIENICKAVDTACIWYWKEVFCLQRSAASACLLRRYGVPAQMMIGVQKLPFRAHAWVEVEGQIVNDKPYMRELYVVLDHC